MAGGAAGHRRSAGCIPFVTGRPWRPSPGASVSDVRAAVAGYRQPDLAVELAAARELLAAAGIACRIAAADTSSLAAEVDAALAWTIREGSTNVVRHSRADRAAIVVETGPDAVTAEITDDGAPALPPPPEPGRRHDLLADPGPAQSAVARLRISGSGLAGLAESLHAAG